MIVDFFRFPHTPHIVWLGDGAPRDDKVLSASDVASLLNGELVVEEKVDGANLGLSIGPDGSVRAQNRGQFLEEPHAGQFSRLPAWLTQNGAALDAVIRPDLMLFGEWCAARHSLDYVALPDWFILFDVYDRSVGRFWNTRRRNALAREAGLAAVPQLFYGSATLVTLKNLLANATSRYRNGALEGLVVRRESSAYCDARAKLVRPEFTQAIDKHWRKRVIDWNHIDYSEGTPE